MKLPLDGNAFLWWRNGSRRLSTRAANEIRTSNNDIVVSVATLWEIAIKQVLGKIQLLEDFEAVLENEGFTLCRSPMGISVRWRDYRCITEIPSIDC